MITEYNYDKSTLLSAGTRNGIIVVAESRYYNIRYYWGYVGRLSRSRHTAGTFAFGLTNTDWYTRTLYFAARSYSNKEICLSRRNHMNHDGNQQVSGHESCWTTVRVLEERFISIHLNDERAMHGIHQYAPVPRSLPRNPRNESLLL